MKANQFAKNEKAEVGIGTMIVFIATILVAAVAAGVLINTSQKLQDKSTRTGADSVENVATSLQVIKVFGDRQDSSTHIREIEILAKLAAGAEPVDLRDLVVTFSDGTRLLAYSYGNQEAGTAYSAIPDNGFYIDPIRDTDSSLVNIDDDSVGAAVFDDHASAANDDTYKGLLNDDDVVMIRFAQYDAGVADTQLDLAVNKQVTLRLATSNGAVAQIGFTTPSSFAVQQHYELA